MKQIRKFFALGLLFAFVFTAFACAPSSGQEDPAEKNDYVIQYYLDGVAWETQTVQEGESFTALTAPVKDNYDFDGWYMDVNYRNLNTYTTMPNYDFALYGKYNLKASVVQHTVTLKEGDTTSTVLVTNGEALQSPASITDNYVVNGWKNENGEAVSFPLAVNSDITLVADCYSNGLVVNSKGVVTGYTGLGTIVIIPETLNGTTIKAVGTFDPVFDDSTAQIKEIVIPETVTSIGDAAFAGCKYLEVVNFPKNVTSLGEDMFSECESLKTIDFEGNDTYQVQDDCLLQDNVLMKYFGNAESYTIPASITDIVTNAFSYSNCKELVVPSTVTYIEANAFQASNVKTVVFNANVNKIPAYAFANSKNLETVKITSSVTEISRYAFSGCEALDTVEFTDSVTTLGASAFEGCISLENFDFKNAVMTNGTVFSFSGLKNYTIADGTTEIKDATFVNWTGLTTIEIPASVERIGKAAFQGCSNLKNVVLKAGSKLAVIDNNAFANTGLETFDFTNCKDTLVTVGEKAFANCVSLTSISFPNSLHTIGVGTLSGCSALENLEIPFVGQYGYLGMKDYIDEVYKQCQETDGSTLTEFGQEMYDNTRTEALYISYICSIESLPFSRMLFGAIFGQDNFTNTTEVTQYSAKDSYFSFYVPNSLKRVSVTGSYISAYAFNGVSCFDNGVLYFGENIQYIGYKGLYLLNGYDGTKGPTELDFSESNLKILYKSALALNAKLVKIVFPDTLEVIGAEALYFSRALEEVRLPASTKDHRLAIGEHAFYSSKELKYVYQGNEKNPEGIITLDHCTMYSGVFYQGVSLKEVYFGDDVDFQAILYNSTATADSNVCSVFSECENLTYVKLPKDMKVTCNGETFNMIPGNLFSHCENLKGVGVTMNPTEEEKLETVLPNVEIIGKYAFQGTGITSAEFPSSVRLIDLGAFQRSALEYVDISNVSRVETSGFKECLSLTEVQISAGMTEMAPHLFAGCSSLETIYYKGATPVVGTCILPEGMLKFSYYGFQGCSFAHIVLPSTLEEISYHSLKENTHLMDVTIPESVNVLDTMAFSGCTALESVVFEGNQIEAIGAEAFQNCVSLKTMDIPEGVIALGSAVFQGCSGLEIVTIPSTLIQFTRSYGFRDCSSLQTVIMRNSNPSNLDEGNMTTPTLFWDSKLGTKVPTQTLLENGVKVYVPANTYDLWVDHHAVWYMSDSSVSIRALNGWNQFSEILTKSYTGSYVNGTDKVDASMDYYLDENGEAVLTYCFSVNGGEMVKATVGENGVYTTEAFTASFNNKTLTITKGDVSESYTLITGKYIDMTDTYSKGIPGSDDADDPRAIQFRPCVVLDIYGNATIITFNMKLNTSGNTKGCTGYFPTYYIGKYTVNDGSVTIQLDHKINPLTTSDGTYGVAAIQEAIKAPIVLNTTGSTKVTLDSTTYTFTYHVN